jgi:hypothetical protein
MRKLKNCFLMAAGLVAGVIVSGILTDSPSLAQVRAALVRDTDNPALQPARILISLTDHATGFAVAEAAPVPAGKRLVIESAMVILQSFGANDPQFDRVYAIWLGTSTSGYLATLDPSHNDTIFPEFPSYVGYTRPLQLYMNPGEVPRLEVWSIGGSNDKFTNVYLHGHYVTL